MLLLAGIASLAVELEAGGNDKFGNNDATNAGMVLESTLVGNNAEAVSIFGQPLNDDNATNGASMAILSKAN